MNAMGKMSAEESTTHFVDKSEWGDGPWQSEPDRLEWRYAGTPRFPLLIVRGPSGALCGYVGVQPGHPWHGKDVSDIDDISVHGGATYARGCDEEGHICHVPRPGESPDVWWIGFDCAHAGDLSPKYNEFNRRLRLHGVGEVYRDLAYVRAEVESLAHQAAAAAKGG